MGMQHNQFRLAVAGLRAHDSRVCRHCNAEVAMEGRPTFNDKLNWDKRTWCSGCPRCKYTFVNGPARHMLVAAELVTSRALRGRKPGRLPERLLTPLQPDVVNQLGAQVTAEERPRFDEELAAGGTRGRL